MRFRSLVVASVFFTSFSSELLGLNRASISGEGVLDHSNSLEELKGAAKNWSVFEFSNDVYDGAVFYSTVGSGISITAVAIYAKPKIAKRWSLRSYQEFALGKIVVKVRGDELIVSDVDGESVAVFKIKHLSGLSLK